MSLIPPNPNLIPDRVIQMIEHLIKSGTMKCDYKQDVKKMYLRKLKAFANNLFPMTGK
jgi:hypothetical protein